jgi:hypothetical protein
MKRYITGSLLLVILLSACQKKVDPVDGSNATVVLKNEGTKFVTDNITVNPKDSLFFSFTITSDQTMKYVSVQKNPVNQSAFLVRDTMSDATAHSYTAVKKFMADSIAGSYVYRIVAHDAVGTYIGHKDIVVTVKPDFNYWVNRTLYVPDTVAKTSENFFAAYTGKTYSYTTGTAKSADIDFGYYFDTASAVKNTIYALNVNPFTPHDLGSWTKNATIFKKITSPTFANLNSAASIHAAGVAQLTSGTSNKIAQLVAGNIILFKTAAGKYGVININYIDAVGTTPRFINVDVRIER